MIFGGEIWDFNFITVLQKFVNKLAQGIERETASIQLKGVYGTEEVMDGANPLFNFVITLTILVFLVMDDEEKQNVNPLKDYTGTYGQTMQASDLINLVVKRASFLKLWIFDPSVKRWFCPEEFKDTYERHQKHDLQWLQNLQLLDPGEGLAAADQQIESIMHRRRILEKKIIDYWKNKT